MSKSKGISSNEKDFILGLLRNNSQRLDHRKLEEFRPVKLSFGESLGSSEVLLGNTRLVVRVSAEITKPFEDRPLEGQFMITTNISSMASPLFENNRASDDEVMVSRLVEKAIRRSNALDLESLCIVAGKSCWTVRADVHYLDYDGNLVDATSIGVVAALLHYRRPEVSIADNNKPIIHPVDEKAPVPLSILHLPLCVTFAFFAAAADDSEDTAEPVVIVDPTAKEEALRDSDLTITINKNREICQLSKPGGVPVDGVVLLECANRAYEVAVQLTELIYKLLKEDDAVRNKGNQELKAENDRK